MTATRSAMFQASPRSWVDDQGGQAELVAQPQQQGEDLAAYGRVERGDRLVGDDEFGLQHEGARDDHALALAAGQLVRVAQEEALRWAEPGTGKGVGDRRLLVGGCRGCAGPRPRRRRPCAAG